MPTVDVLMKVSFPFAILSAPLTYPAPTMGEMAEALARDLRDPDNQTFSADVINDIIRLAFIEVGRIYPKEVVEYVQLVEDEFRYGLEIEDIWRVEIYEPDGTL